MKNFQYLSYLFLIWMASCTSSDKTESTGKSDNTKKTAVSIETIADGIKEHISKETEMSDGYFIVKNDSSLLRLKLVRVHTEYLSHLGPNRYFACVDLADEKGDVYDVDFFMEGEPDNMMVTETTVHKLNGKPFYSWKQQSDKTWKRVPMKNASNQLLGVIEGEDEFNFYYDTTIPDFIESAKVWIPIAQDDQFQQIEIQNISLPDSVYKISTESDYGNAILFADLPTEFAGKSIRIHYYVKRKEKSAYTVYDEALGKYLAATPLLPTGGRFTEIVNQATAGKDPQNNLLRARAIYDYIIDNMRYAKNEKYGTGDAVYACDSKTGNCTEFHSLFISLARTANIPARFAIGAAIPADRNEGGINGYHCWAEFYAEGKWWPIDISEGNKYTALATYYFGHHPANRIELSKGRNFSLTPESKAGKINFFAYPKFEADGRSIVSNARFSFERN